MTGREPGAFVGQLVRTECEELRRHEMTLRQGPNVDSVHDMRVAARRLRAVLRGFRQALPAAVTALDSDVRWLGRVLGEARDLDVQIELLSDEGGTPLVGFVERLKDEREAAQERLLAALGSERYSRLLDDLSLAAAPIDPEPEDLARRAVQELRHKAHSRAKRLNVDSPSIDFHHLRKDVKRLRYVLALSEPVLGKAAQEGIDGLKELQDRLGKRQDADTAVSTLSRLLHDPDLSSEVAKAAEARIREWEKKERKQRRQALKCIGAIDNVKV